MRVIILLVLTAALGSAAVIEIVITEDELQSSMEEAIVDPNVTSVGADILPGKVVMSATRVRPLTGIEDHASMDVYLDVVDGHLSVTVENASWNGLAIGDARIAVWNDRIERGIQMLTGDTHGLLESVTVGSNRITLVWNQGSSGSASRVESP